MTIILLKNNLLQTILGFDGVEISSAYFYTLGQFLTYDTNSRTDEYGGSLENRSRLLFDIMQKLRLDIQSAPVG